MHFTVIQKTLISNKTTIQLLTKEKTNGVTQRILSRAKSRLNLKSKTEKKTN